MIIGLAKRLHLNYPQQRGQPRDVSEALAKATAAVMAQRTSVSNRHAVRTPHTHASVGSVAIKKKKMDQKQRWLPGILPRQGISSPWLCLADARWAASGRSETAWVQTAAPGGSLHEPVGLPVRPSARPAASPPFLPPREGAITFSPDVAHVTNALLAPG